MTETRTPLHDVLEEFLAAANSGSYRSNAESVLTKWIDNWLTKRGITTIEELDTKILMRYTQYLNQRVQGNGIAATSAWTYYNTVSAFLTYAVRWEYLEENYAQKARVQEEMPRRAKPASGEQQFWSPEQRRELYQFVDEQAREAIDEHGLEAREKVRDRAIVACLAYTGARAGEIFKSSTDARRTGITWNDVDLEDGTIRVLGKSQAEEYVPLPTQAARPLQVWKRMLSPPSDEWPAFPTNHRPSIYRALREKLAERGVSSTKIEETIGASTEDPLGTALEHEVVVPSLSTNGARSIMKRLTEAASVEVEKGEYLKPHGGRRGVGEKFAREEGMTAAQRALRHRDPKTTSMMYSHIESSDIAEQSSELFNGE